MSSSEFIVCPMCGLVEDLLVFLGICLSVVGRLKESLVLYHVVREPLVPSWGEKCASKVFFVVWVSGGAEAYSRRGRVTPQERQVSRDFDCTKGYPGEDVTVTALRSIDCYLSHN